jgi:iron(III) transport system permease protein
LAGGTAVVAVPLGTILGVTLGRYAWHGRRIATVLTLAMLVLPLPVHAVAWQIVLGQWLPDFALAPGQVAWRPWRQGLVPAAIVHGLAALPWVALLTAGLLRRIDPALEATARLDGGEATVLRRVVGPTVRLAVAGSLAWCAVLAFTEIAVTDAMMVRTFAEEIYTELVANPVGVPAAVAATVPVWLVAAAIAAAFALRALARPASESVPAPRPRAPAWLVAVAGGILGLSAGLPLAAIVVRASANGLISNLATQLRTTGGTIVESLAAAAIAGALAAGLAMVIAVSLGRSRAGFALLVVAMVVLWLVPGPLLGFAFKEWIGRLLDLEEWILGRGTVAFPPLRSLLYDQPSPVPAILVAAVRFLPLAVAAIVPVVRAVPVELIELAVVDGASRRRLIWQPLVGPAALRAGVAVAVLALGEVSASKLVNPPARQAFVLDLFNQMHYGAEATVAGLALVQVGLTAFGVVVLVATGRR